jgi:hypothetical protein
MGLDTFQDTPAQAMATVPAVLSTERTYTSFRPDSSET